MYILNSLTESFYNVCICQNIMFCTISVIFPCQLKSKELEGRLRYVFSGSQPKVLPNDRKDIGRFKAYMYILCFAAQWFSPL